MTPEVCNSVSNLTAGILTDTRDKSTYSVAKLADGRCWMTANLELTKERIVAAKNSPVLTSADSNVTSDFIMPDTIQELNPGVNNDLNNKDFGEDTKYIAQIYDSGYKNANWKPGMGAYYNWYAATAGTGNKEVTVDGTNVSASLCPKGWRLPTKTEFEDLLRAAGVKEPLVTTNDETTVVRDVLTKSPYNLTMAGWVGPGSNSVNGTDQWNNVTALDYVGSRGNYWSSTVYSSDNAWRLHFVSSRAHVNATGARRYGRSVRCVAENIFNSITDMQDMKAEICDAANIGDAGTLTDNRDNSTYTIRKLSDNNCWMTQNLRLVEYTVKSDDKKTDITDTSDFGGEFTIPNGTNPAFSGTNKAAIYANDPDYGAYYSWYTATAGSSKTSASENVPNSICPAGWRLPTQAEYDTLISKKSSWTSYNSKNGYWFGNTSANTNDTTFFPAAGYYNDSSLNDRFNGYYWSSTVNNSYSARYLFFYNGNAYTDSASRYYGYLVRCVAREE